MTRFHVLWALCSLSLLSACQLQTGTTTITNVSVDGRVANATRTVITDGDGIFDCVRSASGHCYYLLYVERCAAMTPSDATSTNAPTHARHDSSCTTRVVQTFVLGSGRTRKLTDLPSRVQQCVRHDAVPTPADCASHAG